MIAHIARKYNEDIIKILHHENSLIYSLAKSITGSPPLPIEVIDIRVELLDKHNIRFEVPLYANSATCTIILKHMAIDTRNSLINVRNTNDNSNEYILTNSPVTIQPGYRVNQSLNPSIYRQHRIYRNTLAGNHYCT